MKVAIIADDGTIHEVGVISTEPIDYDLFENLDYTPDWDYNVNGIDAHELADDIIRIINNRINN